MCKAYIITQDGPATVAVERWIQQQNGRRRTTISSDQQRGEHGWHHLQHHQHNVALTDQQVPGRDCSSCDLEGNDSTVTTLLLSEPFPTISWWSCEDGDSDDAGYDDNVTDAAMQLSRQQKYLLVQLSRGLERQRCRTRGMGACNGFGLVRCAELYPSLVSFNTAANDHDRVNIEYDQDMAAPTERLECFRARGILESLDS
jgi:hypothetical protein